MADENGEVLFNLDKLFEEKIAIKAQDSQNLCWSLRYLTSESFSWYFLPFNILTEEPQEERTYLTLNKFKEINTWKIKEDMMYYSAPVDLLEKIDSQNNENVHNESGREFMEDLGIVSFLQNQNFVQNHMKSEYKVNKIIKPINFENWQKYLERTDNNSEDNIDKINRILQLIQTLIKNISLKKIKKSDVLEGLEQIISESKRNLINPKTIGYKAQIILENNLLFLFGLINKLFSKEEEMSIFLERYIKLIGIIQSNRLFFTIIEYLNSNKDISGKINIENPFDIFSKKCLDISEIIKAIEKDPSEEYKLILPKSPKDLNLELQNECSKNGNDFWVLNNLEEIFLFKEIKTKSKTKILYYRINIRASEDIFEYEDDKIEKDGEFKLIDFGEINLSTNEEDEINDINITIKNDIIYVCYFINQKLIDSEKDSNKFKFIFCYKLYTTSMILLKEDTINSDEFKYQKTLLYSDKSNIYVITDDYKILVMKKEYSMNSFETNELLINCETKDIIISDYHFYNFINLENILILENKNDKNDLLLVSINKEKKRYVFNLFQIKQNLPDNDCKYKISYNDNEFVFIRINEDKIYFSFTTMEKDNFVETGFRFMHFDTNLMKDGYNIDNNCDAYKKLIKKYAHFVNLYGNFDRYCFKDISLSDFPYSLCCNINTNNLNFIIEQILEKKNQDIEMNYYYIIILKQYICCLYNTNMFKIEIFVKIIDYFRNFIMNNKQIKENKYRTKILKEIIYISSYLNDSNIVEILDIKTILSNKDYEKDLKFNLLLYDLLLTQPKTRQDPKLFEFILEYDNKILSYIFTEKLDSSKENKIISSIYVLYKKVMSKAMCIMNNYYIKEDKELFKYLKKVCDNIINISNLYKNIYDTILGKIPFLIDSLNFSFFYLILERRMVNEAFNKDFEILSSLYNALIAIDKLNINHKKKKAFDLDNIIEITNSKIESDIQMDEKEEHINIINFKSKQNITIQSNFINYIGPINLNSYFEKIILITKTDDSKETKKEIDIHHCINEIFYDVCKMEIHFKENIEFKWRAILDIIPIKDVKEYLNFKNNENFKVLNAIQKSLLYYFLILMKNVDNKFESFLKKDNIKNCNNVYNNEFLQFIYTNDIENEMNLLETKKELQSEEEKDEERVGNAITEIDNFIKNLKYSLDINQEKEKDENKSKSDFKFTLEFLNRYITFFGDFNKSKEKHTINLESYYNKKDITMNQIKSYKDINLEDKSYEKLFGQFEKDVAKKNRLLSSLNTNEALKKIILKLFQIIIKYYNYNSKFVDLIKNGIFTSQNENYNFFLEIYEKCSQMKLVYNQEKSRFIDEKFEEESEKYFKVTFTKLNILYKIIIPSFNENLKYDKYIVQNLIDLIKSETFDPKELLKYSEFQNINCTLKEIELLIINNLLLNLNDEENIKFILHIINEIYNKNKENNRYSIFMSVLDSIYGADYSQMQQVKNYFHLLIGILLEKFILNKNIYNNLGISTKILLFQSLLWKYKGRDFNIMPKLLSAFDDLKNSEIDKKKIVFDLKHEKVFRINNYNLDSLNDIKYEIFKIISSQLFSKIKENLENINIIKEINMELNLKRNLSIINNSDNILNILMSYFSEIKTNNKYYYDLILFFYKNIINSKKLIAIMNSSKFYDVFIKILKIILDSNKSFKNINENVKRNEYTKFIILKLFLQILKNIDSEDKIQNLIECCLEYDKNAFDDNEEESNPFFYLGTKFNLKLNSEQSSIINLYYLKIFLFCLNKIEKSELVVKDNKLTDINFLLSLNENLNQIELKFYTKNNEEQNSEEVTLFSNDEKIKTGKMGTLLCYIDDNSSFDKYYNNTKITNFDYNYFTFNIEQIKSFEKIMVIMDEILSEKIISRNTIVDTKNIKDIILVSNQNNIFNNKYLENNSIYIYDKLISKLINNKLNFKGINMILTMIYNFIEYITIENADKLIKFIFNYISDKEVEKNEKEWEFCSYEYFINEKTSFNNIFYSSSFNINNEIKKEDDEKDEMVKKNGKPNEAPLLLTSLFNYSIINDKDFYIEYKSNNNINKTFEDELTLINKSINKDKGQKNSEIKLSNISFYKASSINESTLITNNSFLLTNKLSPQQELLKIFEENSEKIKAIIIHEIDDSKKEEYNKFIYKINAPIYSVSKRFYDKIKQFFIEGKGGSYLCTNNKLKNNESDLIPIYYPSLLKRNFIKEENVENEEKNGDNNMYSYFYLEEELGLDILFLEKMDSSQFDIDKKNLILSEYKSDILKKYEEINFDLSKVFCLENIKLCHRILYELLKKENIINKVNKEFSDKTIDKIIYIFDSLSKEYYFNIKQNLPIHKLQILLKDFLKSLGKLDNFGKRWSQSFIKYINKLIINKKKLEVKEKDKEQKKKKSDKVNEKMELSLEKDSMDEIYIECKSKKTEKSSKEREEVLNFENNKECDVLLFILKNCNDLILGKNTINIYYEIINNILETILYEKDSSEDKIKTKLLDKGFISKFLFESLDSMYNIIINKKQNSKQLIDCFINNNKFHDLMLKFIDEVIEINNYFIKEGRNKNQNISKNKTLLVQFGFKYLDLCFYIFFKEKQYSLIKYWLNSNNNFFYFYSSYKMLSTDKHYEEIDYKEMLSIIAYISDAITCFKREKIEKNKKNSENKTIHLKENEFNKTELHFKNDYNLNINLTSFSFEGLKDSKDKNIKFDKLAIFAFNRKNCTYNLQDIIDTSDNSLIKNSFNYLQMFNLEDIYLVPLEKISTSLYAFGSNFNHSLGINGKLAKFYDKPNKCVGLPNNVWNIGYGNNYCLALCEDNKKIYACGCNKGGGFNSTPRATFTDDTKINQNKGSDITNKYINFATGNCDSTLLLNESGELYGIGNNEEKIFGFEDEPKLKYPKKLDMKVWTKKEEEENDEEKKETNEIKENKEEARIGKIKSVYIGFKNCYLINNEGKLYGLGNNEYYQISSDDNKLSYENWKNIPLPDNCTKFVDVAVGECYVLCLIEDKEGNNKIYARGKNDYNQCGISDKDKNIRYLTMCDNINNLNFKKIYTRNKESAAITVDGDLYTLNNNSQKFTFVSFDEKKSFKNNANEIVDNNYKNEINEIKEEHSNMENKKIIVDDVTISLSHMLIIARQYDKEKGIYFRKLFGFGVNSKGALGLPINSNKNENTITTITEIPILDENNKKLIPIKLTIGDNKSYVLCINEEDLIQSIKDSKKHENIIYNINIANISKERDEKNILDFYYSKNIDLFINLFKSITSKALSNFFESIDEIKMTNQDLIDKEIAFSINFPVFYDYIIKHQKLTELAHIFIQSNNLDNNINLNIVTKPELESIFNYLKAKYRFITSDLFKYCETNEKSISKQFLQKAIGNNLLYLNAQLRLDRFNELFSKLHRKHGSEKRVEVDRFKANMFYNKYNENPKNKVPDSELNQTIFGQVFQQFGKTKGEDFLIQKNYRLFIVCLQNEYASDSGGPYHEVISQMCQELQSDYLNMFIKTPNNKHDIGLLRDKYIPNPDAKRDIYEEAYEFLGKLMASAVASGEALDLNFHPVVWESLLGNEITFYEYDNIDYTFFRLINSLEKELKPEKEEKKEEDSKEENISTKEDNNIIIIKEKDKDNLQEKYNFNFVIKNSNETDIELKPDGEKIPVTSDNLKEYISLSKKMRTSEFMNQIEFIKKGFNSVIPSSIFQHLYWRQLEEMVCGKASLDIRSFRENTKYDGFQKDDEVIKWFWDWLGKCSEHEQSLYLKFVSGRSRLPKDKNFKYSHIIAKNDYSGNDSFPNSATCFFTLKLPVYKDRETLEKKMNYSILNCDEIDADN